MITSVETINKKDNISRKPYTKATLKKLGDLRAITLGGTTAGYDFSGNDNRGQKVYPGT